MSIEGPTNNAPAPVIQQTGKYRYDQSGRITDGNLTGLTVDGISAPGGFDALKFSSDGKLYGVIGTEETQDADGNPTRGTPIIAPINGWTYDTSALPAPTPQGGKGAPIGGVPGVSYYDANFLPDTGGNLIEVLENGSAVGYARQKLQPAVAPDVRGRSRSYLGSDPRMSNSGPDTRRANPGQNR